MQIQTNLTPKQLIPQIDNLVELATSKVLTMHQRWEYEDGSPVVTVQGTYESRSWTDWTRGFFIGQALLLFDFTGDTQLLHLGRERTLAWMTPHLSHTGVHDHGFNILSTYGNLRRLILEGQSSDDAPLLDVCELALKLSGAVQAMRYQPTNTGKGYIYSFNGPHSLFADTIRSMRSLVLSHHLEHHLLGEAEKEINLFQRAIEHALMTAEFNVYYGEGRDVFDISGRVVHESIFNTNDGQYRCPSTQQGYSPYTTWTRGASWVILGFAELLEYFPTIDEAEFDAFDGKALVQGIFERVLNVTCDYYIDGYTYNDGIPLWDTGAPNREKLPDYSSSNSNPFNDYEPVDSSAAAITAQGLIRYGHYLKSTERTNIGDRYLSAGLNVAKTLFSEPYLSTDTQHEGLILHSNYHHPRGFDHIPKGHTVPCGESTMWGDYHSLELALLIKRMANSEYLTFFA
jgi:unsaturated chondroitin disaccharide hydrolase